MKPERIITNLEKKIVELDTIKAKEGNSLAYSFEKTYLMGYMHGLLENHEVEEEVQIILDKFIAERY